MVTVAIERSVNFSARVLRPFRLMILLVILQYGATLVLMTLVDEPSNNRIVTQVLDVLPPLVPIFLLVLFFWRLCTVAVWIRPERPLLCVREHIVSSILNPVAIAEAVVAYLLVVVCVANFSTIKDMIPQFNPFSWDEPLARLDAFLLGGNDAWTVLLPFAGSPQVLWLLDKVHIGWFIVTIFGTFTICVSQRWPVQRLQYLLALFLVWTVGGNVLATAFSSVGPVFYQNLGLGDRYAPLFEHLREVNQIYPIYLLKAQEALWQGYITNGPLQGISAFPSMHVASVALLSIAAMQLNRFIGILMWIFTAIVLCGTIMLGMHYAVDGYVSLILAYAMWRLAGVWARRELAGVAV